MCNHVIGSKYLWNIRNTTHCRPQRDSVNFRTLLRAQGDEMQRFYKARMACEWMRQLERRPTVTLNPKPYTLNPKP